MATIIAWPRTGYVPEPRAAFRRRDWVVRVAAGEFVGFAIPAAVWGLAWWTGPPAFAVSVIVVAAGACEGAVLGFAQATLLARPFPGIGRPWVGATAAAAALAWAMGMTPGTLADLGAPIWLVVAAMALFAMPMLFSIGVAQWLVLRTRLPRAWRWIAANVAAWFAGLPITFVAPALVPNDAPAWAFLLAFIIAGAAMAVIIATVTGYAITRMLAPPSSRSIGSRPHANPPSRA